MPGSFLNHLKNPRRERWFAQPPFTSLQDLMSCCDVNGVALSVHKCQVHEDCCDTDTPAAGTEAALLYLLPEMSTSMPLAMWRKKPAESGFFAEIRVLVLAITLWVWARVRVNTCSLCCFSVVAQSRIPAGSVTKKHTCSASFQGGNKTCRTVFQPSQTHVAFFPALANSKMGYRNMQ
jgi:hypothetical protein